MLEQYSKPIFERQRTRFPQYIAKLEAITKEVDPRKSTILTLASILAHDLRNDLTMIGVVLELDEAIEANKVLHRAI